MRHRSCPQENDKQLELVLKYHILVQTRTLMYFVNYMYCGILFLSILVNTDIGTKSNICFCILKKQHSQGSEECSFIKNDNFTNTRNFWIP